MANTHRMQLIQNNDTVMKLPLTLYWRK